MRSTSAKRAIAGSACAAGTFAIRILHRHTRDVGVVMRRDSREARCADSESANLATKKFSCLTPISTVAAGRTVAFLRIASADSSGGGSCRTMNDGLRDTFDARRE